MQPRSVGRLQWRSGCQGKTTQVVLTGEPLVCKARLGGNHQASTEVKVTIKRKGQHVKVSDGRRVEIKEERCCLTVPAVYFQEDNSSCLPLAWSFPWDFAVQVLNCA